MFASAPIPTPSSPTTPASPSRPSRLRGLSAIRNYTQSRSLHNGQPNSPTSPGGNGLSRFLSGPASATTAPASPPISQEEGDAAYFAARDGTSERPATSDGPSEMSRRLPGSGRGPASSRLPTMVSNAPPRGSAAATTDGNVPSTPRTPMGEAAAEPGEPFPSDQVPTIRFIPHQASRASRPSLAFPAMTRLLPRQGMSIKVGRYSERDSATSVPPNVPSAASVGFKSKVVSRRHCEFWCTNGQWFVKDVKSSSGTFLNNIRLSQPSVESRPFPVNDGDVIQLGIDFRGGEEQIFRCVKMRVECNRAWQNSLNNFNKSTHKRLKALGAARTDSDNVSNNSSECSICLMSIAPCQSLFVAPCSHVWHFRCIRRILMDPEHYPQFLCPNCRAVADLEADVDDVPPNWGEGDTSGEETSLASAPAGAARPRGNTRVGASSSASARDPDLDLAIAASLQEQLHVEPTGADEVEDTAMPDSAPAPSSAPPAPSSAPPPPPSSMPLLSTTATLSSAISATPSNSVSIRAPRPPSLAAIDLGPPVSATSLMSPMSASLLSPGHIDTPPTATGEASEGPLTPRNEAGPFIFDGGPGGTPLRGSAGPRPDGEASEG